jgi:ubiquitin carboxyl-terminal hydrolase 34
VRTRQHTHRQLDARRNVTSTPLLQKLPRIMMLHLKRFEFDLEKMRNVKLNDRCEFPMSLNMEPYTKEYIGRQELDAANLRMSQDRDDDDVPRYPPEYYEYQLVGIVVHQGSADSGHYYSFIKVHITPAHKTQGLRAKAQCI